MDKIIWKELSEDDRVFNKGFVISSPKLRTDINKPKTNKENKNGKSNKKHSLYKRKYTPAS